MIMIAQKLTPLWETIVRLRWLLFIIGSFYLGSLAGGVLVGRFAPPAFQSLFVVDESRRIESVEKIFGRFRAPVREGRVATIVLCIGLVFGINMLGSVLNTLSSAFLVPVLCNLGFGGWIQGVSFAQIQATSSFSLLFFLLMGSLEWLTYPLAAAAGVNVGLSVLWPKWQNTAFRRSALRLAWWDARRLFLLIAAILLVQAILEMLYVRQVLLHGGTGVPLAPY
jgi:hypothetical protein